MQVLGLQAAAPLHSLVALHMAQVRPLAHAKAQSCSLNVLNTKANACLTRVVRITCTAGAHMHDPSTDNPVRAAFSRVPWAAAAGVGCNHQQLGKQCALTGFVELPWHRLPLGCSSRGFAALQCGLAVSCSMCHQIWSDKRPLRTTKARRRGRSLVVLSAL